MSAVLFAPHNDDEVLWCFYQVLRYRPKVIIVYRSFKEAATGGPKYFVRETETDCAMSWAEVEWEQWGYPDNRDDVSLDARTFHDYMHGVDLVIGPAYEAGGHEQHNAVAAVLDEFHDPTQIRYLTYKRGHGRSEGIEVVPTAEEAALKRQALACYASQAAYPPTAPWFGEDQREFVA